MKKIISIALFFISAGNGFAQQVTFQKTYGGANTEEGRSIKQTIDGGYIVAGFTFSFGGGTSDDYLIKTNAVGDILWTKTFGGINNDYGYAVQLTNDGGYIIAGSTYSYGSGGADVYLIKTDSNGDTLWTKTYGGLSDDWSFSVEQTNDNGYVIAGYTGSFGAGLSDVYLIKTDSNGDILWTMIFGGIGYDAGYSVQQTFDSCYIIVGSTTATITSDEDVYLIKTNSSGDTLWTKTFGGTGYDRGNAVQQTNDGGYIITGYSNSFGAGGYDVYLIKTDSSGNTLWTKTFGGIHYDEGNSIHQTNDGGYIIAGYTGSFGNGDVYLIKTDLNGDIQWTKTFGDIDIDYAYSVIQSNNDGYITAGFYSSSGIESVYLIKTDSMGNSGCNQGNPATIVTTSATQITSPPTIVTSPPTIVTTPATIVGSGGTVTTLCTTVGIPSAIPNPQSAITISPNPTTNNFTITFPNTINKGVIEIYNVLGKKIYKSPLTPKGGTEVKVPIGDLGAGIYFVKVKDGEREYCKKLVIE